MAAWIVLAIVFALIAAVTLGIVIPLYIRHFKATGRTLNYNATMSKFIYRIYASPEDTLSALTSRDTGDELDCRLAEEGVLEFSCYGSSRKYRYMIEDRGTYSILRLEQISRLAMSSNLPYMLNPFIMKKIGAEPMPVSEY